jgi:hypothetical protein
MVLQVTIVELLFIELGIIIENKIYPTLVSVFRHCHRRRYCSGDLFRDYL